MLLSLTIRDVVLIERLDLAFPAHLSVLTGETGAGKSILLDALGLALGMRAESGLVRRGAQQAIVAAEFDIGPGHAARAILTEQGIDAEDTLVLRRVLGADGRSRGFVNDQPVGVGLLKQLGDTLVEIQGQFEQRGLMDPANHRTLLDAFAGARDMGDAVRTAWQAWRGARDAREAAKAARTKAAADEEYLRHALSELDALKPQPGEETLLAEQRARLMHSAQVAEAMTAAAQELAGERGADHALNVAARALERVRDKAGGVLDGAIAALERALVETEEARAALDQAMRDHERDGDLESVEERLFNLRALARKHGVAVDGLADLRDDIARRLGMLEDGEAGLKRLAKDEAEARARYTAAAERLTRLRQGAAQKLDRAVQAELAPLKLDRARFSTTIAPLAPDDWGADGAERVAFEVATNPGAAPGPMTKIASGGELSRFLLALKVVLARVSSVPTIVFDEVDSGIGGAVAAAVGERLARLGQELQVLVVTHSPQVAARGRHHWRVAKNQAKDTTVTRVESLDEAERREEIARMLSGASITEEARAAAQSLLAAGAA
ncbi:DNA repair protein RecN [Aliidongia dinghuensis]|uniref:DNA repair protein RecN n=1 Tax=Aliidongia dinghuensis TaxID=1867774 RepID=A0A8J3E3A2_9PROT|nr:DNA repair protein RecN [Aliidongia dinghuensis]GGF17395.1 DNA repair protein RecN [Aliidongia dinghuensis]